MARRRRYDTEALVGQLKAERRTGILLSLGGVAILAGLLVLYLTGVGGEELPKVPDSAQAANAAPDAGKPSPTLEEPAAGAEPTPSEQTPETRPEPEPEPEPEPQGPGRLKVQLSRKGVVWLGRKKLGKFKRKDLEIPAGKHMVKAKVGRRTLKKEIDVGSGGTVSLFFDHRKKKVFVKVK